MSWTCMWCGYNPDFVCDGFSENATTGVRGLRRCYSAVSYLALKSPLMACRGDLTVAVQGQGYVAHSEAAQTIVLGFRGSANFINTIVRLALPIIVPCLTRSVRHRPVARASLQERYRRACPCGLRGLVRRLAPCLRVSRSTHGLSRSYESVASELRPVVEQLVSSGNFTTIVATGHSLGAAMAGIAALDMRLMLGKRVPRVALINMGMPRTGNKAWADYFATQSIETYCKNSRTKDS